jgi:arylamine N-acetyltransferase
LFSLRGRVLKIVRGSTAETRTLESEREFESVLREVFGIDAPDVPSLWPKVVARHETWLRERGKT